MFRESIVMRWKDEILAGVAGGLLLSFAFPPWPTRWLVLVALAPLFRYFLRFTLDGRDRPARRAAFTCFLFGFFFFLALLSWVSNLIPSSSARMPWLMVPAVLILGLYLSVYTTLFGLLMGWLLRRFGRGALAAAPAIWGIAELARSRGELGFSWGILSSAMASLPVAIQGLAVYGPVGLSMLIVLANLLFALVFFGRSRRGRVAAGLALILLVAGHAWWGAGEIDRLDREREEARERPATAAIVQPNLDLAVKWQPAYRDSIFGDIELLARRAGSLDVDIVVFPETAAPAALSHCPSCMRSLQEAARAAEADLLIGFIMRNLDGGEWRSRNSAGLFTSSGRLAATYGKVNLLPFGERIPWSQYLPFLEKLDFGQANFLPGREATLFTSSAGRFGALICFESTFSWFAREYAERGADFLVNITNDGWFGSARGPLQHAETAILRAVENRLMVLRAANTGVSMVIDPAGRVTMRLGLGERGVMRAAVWSPARRPLYSRRGHLVTLAMALLDLAVAAAVVVRSRV